VFFLTTADGLALVPSTRDPTTISSDPEFPQFSVIQCYFVLIANDPDKYHPILLVSINDFRWLSKGFTYICKNILRIISELPEISVTAFSRRMLNLLY